MTDEAREARREYFRKWRQENPDKVRDAKRRYWEKKAKQAADEEGKTNSDVVKAERMESMKTQGVKGCKLPRINMALAPTNYKWVRTMARASGISMTAFINNLIYEYRMSKGDLMDEADTFINHVSETLYPVSRR